MPATTKNDHVGVAFALVLAAGAATAIGASVVFVPSLVKLASRRVLAGSLAFAAGVMTYLSFVEIFDDSKTSFASDHTDSLAFLYSTLSFFAGVLIMMVIVFRSHLGEFLSEPVFLIFFFQFVVVVLDIKCGGGLVVGTTNS